MKLLSQKQLADPKIRLQIIKELNGTENVARKKDHLRRYELYKDQIKKYVIESLQKDGLMPETIRQMESRAACISILPKIVNKLARTYVGGVSRETGTTSTDVQVSDLARLIKLDEKMKKSDRLRELHKNGVIQIVPENQAEPEEMELWKLSVRPLSPWQYDIVEDANDNEKIKVVILSDYSGESGRVYAASEAEAGIHSSKGHLRSISDGIDQTIADSPSDTNQPDKTFIWWTGRYHFCTDIKGNILYSESPEDIDPETNLPLNPIERLPFVNNAEDQDGFFWAQGGDDLSDGSILINKMLTDMHYLAYIQGYGQPVITGKNLKTKYTMGPNQALLFEYDPELNEPKPEVNFVSANPPLDQWSAMIQQYVALLLTTNNLSVRNIAAKLDFGQVPSGVALMVEQAEVTNEVGDKRKEYQNIERSIWDILIAWHNLALSKTDSLYDDEFAAIGLIPEDTSVSVQFGELKQVVTEKEMLDNIKLRKELGINEEHELLMIDQPDLTEEEAKAKLLKIKQAKLQHMVSMATNMIKGGDQNAEQDDDDSGARGDQETDDSPIFGTSESGD